MSHFSLSHLDPTEFEELCRDLLEEIGFQNINWRKGTDLNASPADQGRDIECEYHKAEVDGSIEIERWFIECKHYAKSSGVPFLRGCPVFDQQDLAAQDRLGTI